MGVRGACRGADLSRVIDVDLRPVVLPESGLAISSMLATILGVQEGGYLLLAPLVGLPPDAALALSLTKCAREILLGLPGLLVLHFSERSWQRRRALGRVPAVD